MKTEIGNKVKFVNENLEGEVVIILSDKKVVVSCSDGFEREVSVNEILVVGENNEISYSVDETIFSEKIVAPKYEKVKSSLLTKYINTSKYKVGGVIEVDLHLEELVEFPEKLDDWQRLHTQMQHVKNCLNASMNKKIRRIVFIHGVGTGVLKTELLNYLANFEQFDVKDADAREYGAGATEVYIKNS